MMAILLLEHVDNQQLDILRVLKMLIVHDLVEIDAGDTFAYDEQGHEDKYEREQAAARRLFGMLPDDQREELMTLWEEFEARQSPEAQYAAALDRLQPLIQNYRTEGVSWREHGVTSDKVLARNRHIGDISSELWAYVQSLVADSVNKGYLKP
jgi:putative hydrolase of HD superfamily